MNICVYIVYIYIYIYIYRCYCGYVYIYICVTVWISPETFIFEQQLQTHAPFCPQHSQARACSHWQGCACGLSQCGDSAWFLANIYQYLNLFAYGYLHTHPPHIQTSCLPPFVLHTEGMGCRGSTWIHQIFAYLSTHLCIKISLRKGPIKQGLKLSGGKRSRCFISTGSLLEALSQPRQTQIASPILFLLHFRVRLPMVLIGGGVGRFMGLLATALLFQKPGFYIFYMHVISIYIYVQTHTRLISI